MGRSGRGVFAGILITALVLAMTGTAGASLPYDERRLTDEAATQGWGTISGDKVVWRDERNGSADVWYEDLVTGAEVQVTNSPSVAEGFLDIDGDLIVWEDKRHSTSPDVYAYDIPTGEERRITSNTSAYQGECRVSGDRIVYSDARNDGSQWDIYMYDWSLGTESLISTHSAHQDIPDISGDIIVWRDFRAGFGNEDIYGYDLNTGMEFPICTESSIQDLPSVHGDIVSWVDFRHGPQEIYMYDLSTGVESRVTNAMSVKLGPAVGDRYITWTDYRLGSEDIFAYDLEGGFVTDVITDSDYQNMSSSSGGHLVWADDRVHGGTTTDIYMADVGARWTRAAGANRYETAVDIAVQHPTLGDDVAIIATGEDFPDALSAAGLAGVFEAPLFLVERDNVPTAVAAELARRDVGWIIIVGGESAVSKDVFDWLDSRYLGVHRLSGSDRYATASAVAGFMNTVKGGGGLEDVFLARGDSFPDALALSPIAFAREIPILLTRPGSLPGATSTSLAGLNAQNVFIAGGEAAVGAGVQGAVDSILAGNGGRPSLRWAGSDRYSTAAEIADEAAKIDWVNVGFVGVATGLNFPDALAGGAAAGREHGVLLLSGPQSLAAPAEAFLNAYADGVDRIQGFGGTAVMSDAVLQRAMQIVNQ